MAFNTGSWWELTTEAGMTLPDSAYPGTGQEHLGSYSVQLKTTLCPNLLHFCLLNTSIR